MLSSRGQHIPAARIQSVVIMSNNDIFNHLIGCPFNRYFTFYSTVNVYIEEIFL